MTRTHKHLALALATLFAAPALAHAAVTFIGEASISGQGTDLSGLPGYPATLEDGYSPQNGLNGFGSGIAYAGGNTYYLLADRGPNKLPNLLDPTVDNTTSYANRYQTFTLNFIQNPAPLVTAGYPQYNVQYTNTATTLLKNAQGVQYTGLSTGFSTDPAVENHRLDPEGIRVAPDGTTWISDEYGPNVLHFNAQGQEIGALTIPSNIAIANPARNAATEAATNTTGRVTNKGAEGLAISPDGNTLVVAMQDPLIQDGGSKSVNDRILVYDLTKPTAAPKQYLYKLNATSNGISEILAVNNHQFLVDERDGVAGANGTKDLYSIDLSQATAPTDLTDSLAAIPGSAVPLDKTLFADIGGILNAAGNPFTTPNGLPDKIEGYAWGPDLADGRHLLLATNDNDFTQPGDPNYRPNYVFAFAVDPSDVPGYTAEFGATVPEPASLSLLAIGAVTLLRRRRA